MIKDKIVAIISEIGMLHQTPLMPMNLGSIINKGVRKRTCLDNDNNIDFFAFPMLWKKFPMTIGQEMIGKVSITILMPSMEYFNNSSSVVKRRHTNLGIVSPIKNPIVNVMNAKKIAFFNASVTLENCRAP